ncbi:molybdenum ABC transporter ATP-binding protein [Oceanicola sp. 502str15]|uniref:molybdenum ABC transporter ATP-binding protein n=1 Tax=Oceanicola sp. 502str15 TaxID=2696061 RepID=UPI002094A11B|nr:molybdenum ABC transporter ATP-binding protein [Oceanicola sp. 502str15]MCO6381306.1 molybdenum ABC transporter ATP-binding protein [Oceanicola sp. 502str15]
MTLEVAIRVAQGSFALEVEFAAPQGITVLYGRSGAGKTSIINAVAGLSRPAAGRIAVDGEVLFDSALGVNLPPHRRRMGCIFQDARLFPHLTVAQNLRYGRWFSKTGPEEARVVEMLGIGPLLGRRPGALSGGERQRVAIGRALMAGPRMLLADEPLAALDEARKAEILPYFERLRDEMGVPVLYVSHAPAEVARLATTVVALDGGKAVRQGPAADVLGDPQVMPLGPRAAGTVLEARVVAHHSDGLSELEAGGLTLYLPAVSHWEGSVLRVHIQAADVMLATEAPRGISALNVWPAVVTDLRMGTGPGAIARLDAGGQVLLARITRRSAEALKLAPGREVFAVLKAVSVAPESVA